MWLAEFGDPVGEYGFLPYYYEVGDGRGQRANSSARVRAGLNREEQAPQPGIPIYARNRRGVLRACYRNSQGRLVAFSSSGLEEENLAIAEENPDK